MPVPKFLKTGVYCFRNKINGKRYAGSASASLVERKRHHENLLKNTSPSAGSMRGYRFAERFHDLNGAAACRRGKAICSR